MRAIAQSAYDSGLHLGGHHGRVRERKVQVLVFGAGLRRSRGVLADKRLGRNYRGKRPTARWRCRAAWRPRRPGTRQRLLRDVSSRQRHMLMLGLIRFKLIKL